ncbi:Alginate export [Sphingobium sp. AP50]|uniref:alginate export family protein n=1 Tax=Sphingobium sp. AP50 TaxID=1884369 RepID=UPI0008D6A8A4|nr:alginate export family protein [Sphingobium sp. AP50]SEJ80553.1 Alginate export [Sphingobium sp. AP50]
MTRRLAFCLAAVLPGIAHAQSTLTDHPSPTRDVSQPPTLTIDRYREDWSVLADPEKRTGRWTEPFKYIPLDANGSVYLTTGLEVRVRNENYDNLQWGSHPAPDQGYLWTRLLPYADLHVGQARAFVQPIIAYASGVKPRAGPTDETGVDMLQAFVNYDFDLGGGKVLRFAAGRQMLSLGSERLIGTRYGVNIPLAYDGGRVILLTPRFGMTSFYLKPVEAGPRSFDDRSSHNRAVWGAYATRWLDPAHKTGFDLYYLGFRNAQARYDQGSGREVRHTLGVRSFGVHDQWRWNVEGMYQFGQFAGAPIRAWSFSTALGYRFDGVPLTPDLSTSFGVVSGDRDRNRPGLQRFNALFPKGKYFGELSPIGPANIIGVHPQIGIHPMQKVTFSVAGMAYWRQSLGDGVYDVPGNLLRSGAGSRARFIGKQAEAVVGWQATPELNLSASASLFKAGRFIAETGPARTIHMLGLEANFRY